MKKESHAKLTSAIEKRKIIKKYFSLVLSALKSAITEVFKSGHVNKKKLDEMVSLLQQLEGAGPSGSKQHSEGLFVTELISLLDESTSGDTIETLKERMDIKYRLPYEGKLALASTQVAEIEKQQKFRIAINLLDSANNSNSFWDPIQGGFTINWRDFFKSGSRTTVERDLLLLSHVTFSMNKGKPPIDLTQPKVMNGVMVNERPLILTRYPDNGQWIRFHSPPTLSEGPAAKKIRTEPIGSLYLKFFHALTPVGNVHIRPMTVSLFYGFARRLGELLHSPSASSSDYFSITLEKVFYTFIFVT